jgi:hypothetical protein
MWRGLDKKPDRVSKSKVYHSPPSGKNTNTPQSHAQTLQSSLAALAEKIDEVKSDHDKLESENKFLQDYIGGLTRTMSKGEIVSTSGSGKGKK